MSTSTAAQAIPTPAASTAAKQPASKLMGVYLFVRKLAYTVFLQASPLDSDPATPDSLLLDPSAIVACIDCLEFVNGSIVNPQLVSGMNLLLLYVLTAYVRKASYLQSKTTKGPRIVTV